jgi:drug/metabolite transporter superfamily protein YnfA
VTVVGMMVMVVMVTVIVVVIVMVIVTVAPFYKIGSIAAQYSGVFVAIVQIVEKRYKMELHCA